MLGNRPLASNPIAASSSVAVFVAATLVVCVSTIIRAAKAIVTIKGGCDDCD
jgi:hypothetical protein